MAVMTTAAITLIVGKLAEKGLDKAFDTTVEKISEGAIAWVKNLFTRNGKARQELADLESKPDSAARLKAVSAILERELEDNPESARHLEEIYDKMTRPEVHITKSKNVNTGTINSGGGDVQLGDNYGQ
ncbi:hypothetical protein D3C87_405830 [compost metagenome]